MVFEIQFQLTIDQTVEKCSGKRELDRCYLIAQKTQYVDYALEVGNESEVSAFL
jgi:hypothetical protein